MQAVTLVFPHQLFKEHPAVCPERPVYLIEEALFFTQYNFHKQKLVLHRATMKMYAEHLQQKNITVHYVQAGDACSDIRKLMDDLLRRGVKAVHYAAVTDNWLEKRISAGAAKGAISCVRYASPNFLNAPDDVKEYFDKKGTYFQTDFYIWQRRQRGLLLNTHHQPEGGKWTYDAENRLRFSTKETPPVIVLPPANEYVREARDYVSANFAGNYGALVPEMQPGADGFYPTTYAEAEQWLDNFLCSRFQKFGVYQDAMVGDQHFLHHSVLTPMLNTGILNSGQVIRKAIEDAARCNIPMNSLEGFIRQIIGWREFIRIVYEREGTRQRTRNFWGFTRKIPASFRTGNTGIVPVDSVIRKLLKTGYSHHIERLMVMANFMLLCEFDPDEVYRWFMEMYIDSYDWVMVPNVYGMTQFADGGLMATKPYISGSNYIMKMSDYKKGPWQQVWDGLFWRFMQVNRDFFSQNPRLGMLLKTFDNMPAEKKKMHLYHADAFLAQLDSANE